MDFEEKIDAMRMTLELAIHDIEAQRVAIEAQRAAAALDRESTRNLVRATDNLLQIVQSHERRLGRLEGEGSA